MPHYKRITGGAFALAGLKIWWRIARLAQKEYGWRKVLPLLKKLEQRRRKVEGDHALVKAFKINGRYFWNFNTPAYPSLAFDRYHQQELSRLVNLQTPAKSMAVMAITKKCPLNCAHCFEGEVLNQRETVSEEKLLAIVDKLIEEGVNQIQFSGGEPLNRFSTLLKLTERARPAADTWIYTSGYNLGPEKARQLAAAGVTGICVSLEHYQEVEHNKFRRNERAFAFAKAAIENAREAGVATAISVCAIKEFVNREFLEKLLQLAADWQVTFVQLLEPRAVGNFAGMDVALSPEQIKLLEEFYLEYNFSTARVNFPSVKYHAYYQRRVGCFNNRMLYIDTDGRVEACPFCRSARPKDYLDMEQVEEKQGCQAFATADF